MLAWLPPITILLVVTSGTTNTPFTLATQNRSHSSRTVRVINVNRSVPFRPFQNGTSGATVLERSGTVPWSSMNTFVPGTILAHAH